MPIDFENSKRPTQDELDMMRWEGEGGRVGEASEIIENPAFNQTIANFVARLERHTLPTGVSYDNSPKPVSIRNLNEAVDDVVSRTRGLDTDGLRQELGSKWAMFKATLVYIAETQFPKTNRQLAKAGVPNIAEFTSKILAVTEDIATISAEEIDRELLRKGLPTILEISSHLKEAIDTLPEEARKKVSEEARNLLSKLKDKFIKREAIPNSQEYISDPVKGFTAPKVENLNRESIEKVLSDLKELFDKTVDSEARKKITQLISTISLLLSTLPFLSASSPITGKVEARNIYGDLYSSEPSASQFEAKNTVRREVPDLTVSKDQIDILREVTIQNAEISFDLFGEKLGSKLDTRGKDTISIENKTGNKSVIQEMTESERKPDFIIVTEVDGEKVLVDLQKYIEIVDGNPAINLNKLSDTELNLLRDNPLIWGDFGFLNGEVTSSFVQRGQITGISERAGKIISERVMNRIIEERNRNIF